MKGAGSDIANEPPSIPSLMQLIAGYKVVKYNFQERITQVRAHRVFTFPRLNERFVPFCLFYI